jgi:V-type H+-transporting ATPase subunit a
MGLLRSEAMSHGTLVLPCEGAREYIDRIGKELKLQFEDMNDREMRRPYRKFIQRIEEMERVIRLLATELPSFNNCQITKNKIDEFLCNDSANKPYVLEEVEGELAQLNKRYVQWKENNASLLSQKNAALEELAVVTRSLTFSGPQSAGLSAPLLGGEDSSESRINRIAGVINQSEEQRLRTMVFRASFGKNLTDIYPINEDMQDPKTGAFVKKSVFVIFFQGVGAEKSPLHQKVLKICTALGANMYDWPKSEAFARTKQTELRQASDDNEKVLVGSVMVMQSEMEDLARVPKAGLNSKIEEFRMHCAKEKAIYSVLNLCTGEAALRVNVWFPEADRAQIQSTIKKSTNGKGMLDIRTRTSTTPPTYTRVNDFTEGWQDVINTYGIPRYQEANPALFSLVTFPFIFGMMYGDIGHGSLLLMAGLYLCWSAKQLQYTQPMLYYARFIILQLGFFATFAGFMYNDFFSISLRLFPTRYVDTNLDGEWEPTWDVNNQGGLGPYPFGLDWMWNGAGNELLFVNSLKMKLSVLFGVLQMTLGVFIRWSNAFHAQNGLDFACECIPMLMFMVCFFGWMDFMVLYKWTHNGAPNGPPSIINSLICMAMGQPDDFPFWTGSVEIATNLMHVTMLAVPILLFPKPFILKARHDEAEALKNSKSTEDDEYMQFEESGVPPVESSKESHGHGHGDHEEFEFGEIVIHQVIETIEYVLGTVSHTASYLRIWALSLAHQQLSMVFFSKTLQMGLEMSFPFNGIVLYIMFTAWFGVTLAVLLGMDVMECFLHTLRLHWVEFQSKFYNVGGGGYAFEPFDIKKVVTPLEEA